MSNFGILFDIDGVIAHGHHVIPAATEAFKLLKEDKSLKYPVVFVTNGLDRDQIKADQLKNWLRLDVDVDQVIHACSPLKVFTSLHNKRVLLVGQENLDVIGEDLGFTNICYLDEVRKAFPDLDFVDHEYRSMISKLRDNGKTLTNKFYFEPIEAIVVLGEPVNWEGALQLIIDLLLTNGNPSKIPDRDPYPHIPVLACNMDMVFKAYAALPRFGNGAFMSCLEQLYKRITGYRLEYTAIVGKPSEVTTRYAEHCLVQQAMKLDCKPLKRIYVVGDNPAVDITAANWYNAYLKPYENDVFGDGVDTLSNGNHVERLNSEDIPAWRAIPLEASFLPSTAEECLGILVKTGVYKGNTKKTHRCQSKRLMSADPVKDSTPEKTTENVLEAVKYILKREKELD